VGLNTEGLRLDEVMVKRRGKIAAIYTVHNFHKDKESTPYSSDGPRLSQFAESCVVDV